MAVKYFRTRRKLLSWLYLLLFAMQWKQCSPWIMQQPPFAMLFRHFQRKHYFTATTGRRRDSIKTCLQSTLGSNNYLQSMEQTHPEPSSTIVKAPILLHHTCIKTRNITTAIDFYSLFGYQMEGKFRAGPARAAWLELEGSQHRLELIEIPSHILNERLGQRRRALDLMERQDLLGYNHVALDVTNQIVGNQTLAIWIDNLNKVSLERFGKSLRVALEPKQQMIGDAVFELAFLSDADGCLVELLRYQADLPQVVNSGWEPWDGQFVGPGSGEVNGGLFH
ncbi:hypothetical protein MPSEU_000640600 [Mayamaea pseudoterrestris]|nr:hypothetical protein MPSEU_000640600 [Mayamaea pseudoterrestris]